MVDRIVTGAHYGLRDWVVQRVTAVMMAVYVLFIAGYVVLHPDMGYDRWTGLFANQFMRSCSLLFLLAVYFHAWIGVRDIVMDYVKPAGIRLSIYVAVILVLLLYAIWGVQILWGF
jgi:succinate dehydrogenase / fumarate reductase membrane anchor subunit